MDDELSIHAAADLARGYVTRVVKPFQKVEEVLRAAINAQAMLEQAELRIAALEREEHELRGRLQTLGVTLALKEAEVTDAEHESARVLDTLRAQVLEATQAAQGVIQDLDESAAAKRATLNADYEARAAVLERTHAERVAVLEIDYKTRAETLIAALGGTR